jgi:dienelactone hydrolase
MLARIAIDAVFYSNGSETEKPSVRNESAMPNARQLFRKVTRPLETASRAAVFFLKVFPMLPSRPVDWITKTPVVEQVSYPTSSGEATGDLYRPPGNGPFPGVVICLGVVPFGVDHPQVPILGKALARAGFAALLYWSPAMREFRLEPADVDNIALAYNWLIQQPNIDPTRSGLFGTCVGGSFALTAAATPLIQDRTRFVGAYAPYSSMATFAPDIASASCIGTNEREPWQVDSLTWKVFIHSMTAWLPPNEAEAMRCAFAAPPDDLDVSGYDVSGYSVDGKAINALLCAQDAHAAESALHDLPQTMQARLAALSPMNYVSGLHAPLVMLLHDRGDQVIPVGESRRLHAALSGCAGVHYTEMGFQHLDPKKGRLPFMRLMRELRKFFVAIYPLFRQTVAP